MQTDVASRRSGKESEASPEVARRAAAIARQTMSPFCPGRTLSDCPSPNAATWRADIRAMVEQGMSADQIQDALEARVQENLSGSPSRESSYAVPLGFGLLGFVVLGAIFVRLRRPNRGHDAGRAPSDSVRTEATGGERHDAGVPRDGALAASPSAAYGASIDDARLREEMRQADGDFDD